MRGLVILVILQINQCVPAGFRLPTTMLVITTRWNWARSRAPSLTCRCPVAGYTRFVNVKVKVKVTCFRTTVVALLLVVSRCLQGNSREYRLDLFPVPRPPPVPVPCRPPSPVQPVATFATCRLLPLACRLSRLGYHGLRGEQQGPTPV